MQTPKPFIFNKYYFTLNLLLLIILCLFAGCNGQNRAKQVLSSQNQFIASKSAININTASAEELKKIPNIGAKLSEKIIKHRERFGKFRKPEYLILVPGISDRRFREIRSLIKVE